MPPRKIMTIEGGGKHDFYYVENGTLYRKPFLARHKGKKHFGRTVSMGDVPGFDPTGFYFARGGALWLKHRRRGRRRR